MQKAYTLILCLFKEPDMNVSLSMILRDISISIVLDIRVVYWMTYIHF